MNKLVFQTIIPLCVFFAFSSSLYAQSHTISGFISDETSKELLVGATVYKLESGKGTTSNEYGFYSLSIPNDSCTIVYSYVGYNTIKKSLALKGDTAIAIYLKAGQMMEELVIDSEQASESRHVANSMSVHKIDIANVDKLPILLGEPDVFQLITLKPGVSSGNEGGGINVRGGSADQNLVLLDDVPVYNSNHLFGFLSVFNGDAMKSAKIYKGGFPARYGGRLSSIIDVRMKEGNMREWHGNVNLDVLSWKANIEGPIFKDKTSFMLSARRTFVDLLSKPILKSQYNKSDIFEFWDYSFYDINAKVNHKFSEKSRLYLSAFYGNDRLAANSKYTPDSKTIEEDQNKIGFGNRIFAARWNYQWAPKLFSNATVTYSKYRYKYTGHFDPNSKETDLTKKTVVDIASESDIEDLGAKLDFSYVPNASNYVRFGASYIHHTFTPTTNTLISGKEKTITGDQNIEAHELAAYVEDDIKIGTRIRVNPGVHVASFLVENSNYYSIQPRLSLNVQLRPDMSFKASYSSMTQYIHLLVSAGLGLPTDLWVPSTDNIVPETSQQYAAGITKSIGNGFELTLEGFYKDLDKVVEYKSGQDIFASSDNWENKVDQGAGSSSGIEFLLEKNRGKTTGWVGYTYSKSTRTFEGINNGQAFPFKYDRTHDVNLVLTHKFNKKIDMGLIWVYGTGNAYSFGSSSFYDINGDLAETSERNNHRMAPYHRLDLSTNFHKDLPRGKRVWSLGIYNTYNRQNPFYISKKYSELTGKVKLYQTSLLPIIPFVSYKRSF